MKSARDIFLAALDRSPADRVGYLDEACGDDSAMRQRVEALLRAHDEPAAFLSEVKPGAAPSDAATADKSAAGRTATFGTNAGATTDDPGQDVLVGTVLAGRYKLLEQIGEGGMGSVWMAEQTEPVIRRVAVKLIKPGMDSKQVVARFEAERQALALMDHPNIARVLDGGIHDSRPYFVMELVKGKPITRYCDENRLTIRDRLALFADVCRAVQHAHQKGIIHRDIKPSNVLIAAFDGRPVVKVIDFGVAKATGQKLTEATLFTGFGAVVGTPEYMSPEQAEVNNQDIDTRSDVYSLGVLLYELLTGSTPVDRKSLGKAALLEILRIVRDVEAPRPSVKLSTSDALPSISANRGTDPKKLTGLLRSELDWIVLKALEKDRSRRYETANGFAADVERFLADEPVAAHPPTAGYRLRKFVRKNRGPVTAGAMVFVTLLLGIAGTTVGLVWAEQRRVEADQAKQRESDRADGEERAKVEARQAATLEKEAKEREAVQRARAEKAYARTADVLDVMVSDVTGDSLATQRVISPEQKKFLEGVIGYYREFAGGSPNDERARARHARAASRVGAIEYRLGRQEEAAAAFRIARDGFESIVADFPTVPAYRQDLAGSYGNLGLLLEGLGRGAAAEEQYTKAMAIQEKLAADFPAVAAYRQYLAASHNNLGNLLEGLGRRGAAEGQYTKAMAIQEKLAADFPAVPEYREDLAGSHHNLGFLFAGLGRGAAAEEQYTKAVVIQEKLAADFPAMPDYRKALAQSRNNLGNLLGDLGRGGEAEEQYTKAIAIQERLAAEFPAIPDYRGALAQSYFNLGNTLDGLGRKGAAEEKYIKALSIQETLAAEFPSVPRYKVDLGGSHYNLGNLLVGLGRGAAAEGQYTKAVTIWEKLVAEFPANPEYRSNLAGSHHNLGALLTGLGRKAEAEAEYKKGQSLLEKLVADFPSVPQYQVDLAGSHSNVGKLIFDSGDPAGSVSWHTRAVARLQTVQKIESLNDTAREILRNSHMGLAQAHDQLRKHAEAVKDWDKAIEFSPKAEQPLLRASRVISMAKAGQVQNAVAEVVELQKRSGWDAGHLYDFACVYAIASAKVGDKQQNYATVAMELLQKAVKAGYKDAAHINQDPDLDPLRQREDFKKLLAELTRKGSAGGLKERIPAQIPPHD